jgi:hypothetical protein
MDNQDIIIIILIFSILLLLMNNNNEKFGPVSTCSGAAAPISLPTCGSMKVKGEYCVPDKNDCYDVVGQEKHCYCKPKNELEGN